MSADQTDDRAEGLFTQERVSSFLLVILTFVALYVCYRIIQPFIPALAFAVALAVATSRPYGWLKARVRGNNLAAAIAVICVMILILAPLAILTSYIVQAAIQNIEELRDSGGVAKVRAQLESTPLIGPWISQAQARFDFEDQIMKVGQGVASRAGGVLAGSFVALSQIVITLFVLFFLYRDADSARGALLKLLPLAPREAERMAHRVAETIQATVNGSVTVAVCQSVLATTIYAILGVPLFVLWGSATFFAAFVPVFGTSLIWIPVSCYLLLTGAWVKAIILIGWSALVIGSIDNILYPFLVGDKLKVHTLLTFFAVLGGVGLFGASGIILGPMVLAITVGLLEVWSQRMEESNAGE